MNIIIYRTGDYIDLVFDSARPSIAAVKHESQGWETGRCRKLDAQKLMVKVGSSKMNRSNIRNRCCPAQPSIRLHALIFKYYFIYDSIHNLIEDMETAYSSWILQLRPYRNMRYAGISRVFLSFLWLMLATLWKWRIYSSFVPLLPLTSPTGTTASHPGERSILITHSCGTFKGFASITELFQAYLLMYSCKKNKNKWLEEYGTAGAKRDGSFAEEPKRQERISSVYGAAIWKCTQLHVNWINSGVFLSLAM